jgi:hypothetical protein
VYHYSLGDAGLQLVAAVEGRETREVRRPTRLLEVAASRKLNHLVATNEFFVSLHRGSRIARGGAIHVREWWGERRCQSQWGEWATPDGYGLLDVNGRGIGFVLELDRATESRARIEAKLARYDYMSAVGEGVPVAICATDDSREAQLSRWVTDRAATALATVVVASLPRHIKEPFGAIWWSPTVGRRIRLLDLGDGK